MNDLAQERPGGVRSYEELSAGLAELRVRAGISYRELHRRVLRQHRSRRAEQAEGSDRGPQPIRSPAPAFDTVYRCLQPGRRRLDPDLVADIAGALGVTDRQAWFRACAALARGEPAVDVTDLPPRPDLVGRGGALRILGQVLSRADDHPVAIVTGMAGVGKTALAVEAAHRAPAGARACFVDLAGFGTHREPVGRAALVEALLRRLAPERRPPVEAKNRLAALRRLLATRPVLLVLDNAGEESQVAELLPGPGAASRVLITSRNRLNLPGRTLSLDGLTAVESAALLARGAGADADSAVLAELAERTAHLPLALSLLSARIAAQPEWSLTDHLDQLRELQATDRLDIGVEASLRLSYADVSPLEQRMLRALSRLPLTGFDAGLAATVGDLDLVAARGLLDRLVRAHLVAPVAGDRFALHDLVRLFLAGRAVEADPPRLRRLAFERALGYLIAATAAARAHYAPQLHVPGDLPQVAVPAFAGRAEATAWLDRHRADLLTMADSALTAGPVAGGVRLSTLLFTYLTLNQYVDDATRLYERVAATTDGSARAGGLLALAAANGAGGRLDRVRAPLESALRLYETLADAEGVARVVHNLAALSWEQGDYAGAEAYGLRALELARESGDRSGVAMTIDNLGILYCRQRRLAESMVHHEQALAIHRDLDDQIKEGRSLSNLGLAATLAGRPDAQEILTGALAVSRGAEDRVGECLALARLADLDSIGGRHDEAIAGYQRAQAIIRERSTVSDEALEVAVGLCAALRRSGRRDEAAAAQAEAAAMAAQAGHPYWTARARDAG